MNDVTAEALKAVGLLSIGGLVACILRGMYELVLAVIREAKEKGQR